MDIDGLAKVYHRSTCRKGDQLFVPIVSSQTSVIKHTNDFKQTSGCQKKQDNLDSGIDSLDDEEEKQSLRSNTSSNFRRHSTDFEILRKAPRRSMSLSLEKLVDVDVEKLHSEVSPITFPVLEGKNDERLFQFDKPFVSSATDMHKQHPLLADNDVANVDLSYLFHLYEQAEPGHLKNTILKLIRNVSNEQCKKLSKVHDSLKGKQNMNFSIDNIIVDEKISQETSGDKLDLVLPPLIPARSKRSFSQSSTDIDVNLKSPTLYPSPTETPYPEYMQSYSSLVPSNYEAIFSKNYSEKPSSEKSFHCEYCHKCFSHKNAWQRHLLTHKGKRTHKCTQCSRSFYEQSAYLRHLQSHNGEKAHKCKQCSMAFSKRSALEVHIRTHTGERPFKCKFCGKGFSISGNLHRHILIHTGHRPYKCGKCPRAFNNPSHLARHISSFHT